jgi:hypothetical protein
VLRAALAALLLAAPPGSLNDGFGHAGRVALRAGAHDAWVNTVRIDPADGGGGPPRADRAGGRGVLGRPPG